MTDSLFIVSRDRGHYVVKSRRTGQEIATIHPPQDGGTNWHAHSTFSNLRYEFVGCGWRSFAECKRDVVSAIEHHSVQAAHFLAWIGAEPAA